MKSLNIQHPTRCMEAQIQLPASKSISNRALIIKAIQPDITLHNLSSADDTCLMQQVLEQRPTVFNLKNAGTCVRFLTAYCAATPGEYTITGDERMKKRPIEPLIDALRQLGADITYLEQHGELPIKIIGKTLNGGRIRVDSTQSSQFVSAILLIAPLLRSDLVIELPQESVSKPYIDLTISMMAHFGVQVHYNGQSISVKAGQAYQSKTLTIESDWSAASYWYEIAVLSKQCNLVLEGLTPNSQQGDSIIADWMKTYFGLSTHFEQGGARLVKPSVPVTSEITALNLINAPDLAPALAALVGALHMECTLTGLGTLHFKETNRLSALLTELNRLGIEVSAGKDSLHFAKPIAHSNSTQQVTINTYNDHRMAMAFAPLALTLPQITIENPEVVNKSYPDFWQHLKQAGFILSE